ncbi:NAD/NADP octopine/nopaline dehydrogenase family protein [Bacillus sp. CMF12]|uniref:NAD/NADP-dependent octopine/nopaline dehydrogenase family protein n=1 Tax=Bacillus sp. CMF12 TaxID=2884834 RepID=UPI00207AFDFF|nr:NAD/NADP-dependent octopine/nopaline dehydrogenase family protein [Bacillus sp. CMF12]USK50680.1 NAD/NADP octopine/nopaline dehydrogenase family protein [Bacillus sp. CMF12]
MSYAVIGAGNTGQAIASYLSLNGKKVKLYSRSPIKAERLTQQGLELKGVYSAKISIEASANINEVIKDAEFIIITTTSFGHKPIFRQLKPFLKNNQTIVIFPGYWGAAECKEVLGPVMEDRNITIAETSAMPFVSKADNAGSVYINRIKKNVQVSSIPTSKNLSISTTFLDAFPQLIPANNIFETSLNNTNVCIHTPITLFNASRIDASEEFKFYTNGVSPLTVTYVEKLDEERRKLADLFLVETIDILTLLNDFYETDYSSLYEALPGLFPEAIAPTTLNHRYMNEDIPFGLVPISELGRKVGIETPYTDSIINTASLLMNKDFRKEGVNFEGLTKEEIVSLGGLTQPI